MEIALFTQENKYCTRVSISQADAVLVCTRVNKEASKLRTALIFTAESTTVLSNSIAKAFCP